MMSGYMSDSWVFPPNRLLVPGHVHVWRAHLDVSLVEVEALYKILTLDEQQRSQRFYTEKLRHKFIVARGALRQIIGFYLQLDPAVIRFTHNQYGKPFLCSSITKEPVHFNVTHSHGMGLYAIAIDREVGIDIEHIRPDFAGLEIAERFFAPQEVLALRNLPPSQQTLAFFYCWTRKEAFVKALGEGLSFPLDQFVVSLNPSDSARVLVTHQDPAAASNWSLTNIMPGIGYAAALAIQGDRPVVSFWEYRDTSTLSTHRSHD